MVTSLQGNFRLTVNRSREQLAAVSKIRDEHRVENRRALVAGSAKK